MLSQDVQSALYFGRETGGSPRRDTLMPFVDSEMDQMPWYYPPANIPPQPNYLTLVFYETSALLIITLQITDVVCVYPRSGFPLAPFDIPTSNGLRPSARSDVIQVDEHITKIECVFCSTFQSFLPYFHMQSGAQ